ncbi:MAG: hypothetical protein LBG17_01960, partial [Bacteroidales bacterium]|nr:hypothetical protein [Bacteroidales bacterium]
MSKSHKVLIINLLPPPPQQSDFQQLTHNRFLKTEQRQPSSVHSRKRYAVVAGNAPHCGQRPTITDKAPSLRALHHHCGQRPANNSSSKKNVKQPKPTITDKAPSLRAMRVIAGNDPQTALRTTTPSLRAMRVIAGYDPRRHCGLRPANNYPRKKKRQTTTPTITDNAPSLRATTRVVIAGNDPQTALRTTMPSLRAMRVIAGYDPQTTADAKKSVKQQRPPLRTKPRRCGLRPATPQLTTADAKKASDKKPNKQNKHKMKKQTKILLTALIATAALTAALT